MKDQLLELSTICRETIGASVELMFLKTGDFRVKINRGNDVKAVLLEPVRDPEIAMKNAIIHIMERRRPLNATFPGMPIGAKFTMKKETAW